MIGYHLDHEPYSIAMPLRSHQFLRTIMELFTWCWGDSTTPPRIWEYDWMDEEWNQKWGGGVFTISIHSKNCLALETSQQLHLPKGTDEATLVLHIPFENKVFLGPPKNSLRNPLAVLGFSSMKGLTKIKKTALLRKKNKTQNAGHLSMIR